MSADLRIECLAGPALRRQLAQLARLRIAVFREWPYLYDGDADYEARYLEAYARSRDSLFVLACDGDEVVGASSGIPLEDDDAAFQSPFMERGIDVRSVFYFGESVLLPAYRGRGIGHRFFDAREDHARQLGRFEWTAFCAVDRAPGDPRQPPGYRGNHGFWRKRGYAQDSSMRCRLSWRELGAEAETPHTLTFWRRRLRERSRPDGLRAAATSAPAGPAG